MVEFADTRLLRAMQRLDVVEREKVRAKHEAGIWKARAAHLTRQLQGLRTADAASVTRPESIHKE